MRRLSATRPVGGGTYRAHRWTVQRFRIWGCLVRRDRVMVDLRGIGDALRAHCRERGVKNLAAFIVPTLAAAIGQPSPARAANEPKADAAGRRKLSVVVDEAAHARLKARAAEAGLTLSAYVATIASAPHLPEIAPTRLSPVVLSGLVQSNYELRAIGRNVNQIAKSLNAYPGRMTAGERDDLSALPSRLDAHVRLSARVLQVLNTPRGGTRRGAS